jgi:isopenicillin N synthase-like dioxygenase
MAKGVGAEPASLLRPFQGQPLGMRVNYYPPCRQADRVLGLSPHTDASGLTLLRQKKDDVQGLQIKKDGKWFAVHVLDGAFVINIGDVLEVRTNSMWPVKSWFLTLDGCWLGVQKFALVQETRSFSINC